MRAKHYLAHCVIVATVTQLTLLWCYAIVSVAGPWHPHLTPSGAIDLGGPGGLDALFGSLLIVVAMLAVGALCVYVLVTSVLALVLRGHWSVLLVDVLLPALAVALVLTSASAR